MLVIDTPARLGPASGGKEVAGGLHVVLEPASGIRPVVIEDPAAFAPVPVDGYTPDR